MLLANLWVLLASVVSVSTFALRSNSEVDSNVVTTFLSQLADMDERVDDKVKLNYQNMASRSHFDHDNAPEPLFTLVDSSVTDRTTVTSLLTLMRFYQPDAHVPETRTAAWKTAISDFLDDVLNTKVMKSAQNFLYSYGKASNDLQTFKEQIQSLWFTLFTRPGGALSSSGFKSLFYGEELGGKVISFNNWIQFYEQEYTKLVNYHGWFSKENGVVIDTQFSWGLFEALEQSFLLNTSPEFEIAAYTVCLLTGDGICNVKILNSLVNLQVSSLAVNGTSVISGCVPKVEGGSSSQTTKHPSAKTTKASANDPQLQTLVDQMRAEDVDKPSQSDYQLNWGEKVGGKGSNKLFTSMNENIFSRKVYDVLIQVFDQNLFTPDVCTAEQPLSGNRKIAFLNVLDTWTSTSVFQSAFNYLKSKGVKEATDMNTMKNFLFNFWFGTYSRCKGPLGSSGFEHVFSGEWKSNTVDGQHNWQRYYLLEKAGKINYLGYYNYDAQLIGTFQYKWAGELKQKGGFLFGTSPAFDFSLLTVCSLVHSGANGCRFTLDGYKLAVTSYTQECASGLCLATAYPTD